LVLDEVAVHIAPMKASGNVRFFSDYILDNVEVPEKSCQLFAVRGVPDVIASIIQCYWNDTASSLSHLSAAVRALLLLQISQLGIFHGCMTGCGTIAKILAAENFRKPVLTQSQRFYAFGLEGVRTGFDFPMAFNTAVATVMLSASGNTTNRCVIPGVLRARKMCELVCRMNRNVEPWMRRT
jgi:hypothetical protein